MTLTRVQVKRLLRKHHVGTTDILRHGSFDGDIGIRVWYDLAKVKAWLVFNGIELVDYRD